MKTFLSRYATSFTAMAAAVTIAVGGRVSMKLTGAKTASVEMRDAGFCVTSASLGATTMHIFAFSANNKDWAVTIRSSKGMPKVGSHPVSPDGVAAGLIDKTTGKVASEWVRYEANSGTVILSSADDKRVAGSFKFSAKQSWPAAAGQAISAEGTFEGTVADGCSDATKPRK